MQLRSCTHGALRMQAPMEGVKRNRRREWGPADEEFTKEKLDEILAVAIVKRAEVVTDAGKAREALNHVITVQVEVNPKEESAMRFCFTTNKPRSYYSVLKAAEYVAAHWADIMGASVGINGNAAHQDDDGAQPGAPIQDPGAEEAGAEVALGAAEAGKVLGPRTFDAGATAAAAPPASRAPWAATIAEDGDDRRVPPIDFHSAGEQALVPGNSGQTGSMGAAMHAEIPEVPAPVGKVAATKKRHAEDAQEDGRHTRPRMDEAGAVDHVALGTMAARMLHWFSAVPKALWPSPRQ